MSPSVLGVSQSGRLLEGAGTKSECKKAEYNPNDTHFPSHRYVVSGAYLLGRMDILWARRRGGRTHVAKRREPRLVGHGTRRAFL